MAKVYAVRKGRETGLFTTWDDCKEQVSGFPGAEFKSFKTREEAERYLQEEKPTAADASLTEEKVEGAYAFVDGSFNEADGKYGYGGFLVENGNFHILMGNGNDTEMLTMRNVSGEILGTQAAVKKAKELGIKELTVFYDYSGIEAWATGSWKATRSGTMAYVDFMKKTDVTVHFEKVKAHSGIQGNEYADVLAKNAVGLHLTKNQVKMLAELDEATDDTIPMPKPKLNREELEL